MCMWDPFTVHLASLDASNTCLHFTRRHGEREPWGEQACSTDWEQTHSHMHTHTHVHVHTHTHTRRERERETVWAVEAEGEIVSVTQNENEGVDHRCLSRWCNIGVLTTHQCQWSVGNSNWSHETSLSFSHTRRNVHIFVSSLCQSLWQKKIVDESNYTAAFKDIYSVLLEPPHLLLFCGCAAAPWMRNDEEFLYINVVVPCLWDVLLK